MLVSTANLHDQLEHERNLCGEHICPQTKLHIIWIPIGMTLKFDQATVNVTAPLGQHLALELS